MMRVGMTGTRKGMSWQQLSMFRKMLDSLNSNPSIDDKPAFHHGDCIGADMEANSLAQEAGYRTYAHPPVISTNRAWCKSDVILPVADYMVRNRDIVEAVDRMLAAPKAEKEEFAGSGTWAAIRYTIQVQKPIMIIFPDGSYQLRGAWSRWV